jgi:small GTP-binding protein
MRPPGGDSCPKVVLVGDSGTGKTSIANAYTKSTAGVKPTITATALRACRAKVGNKEVCFDLWDTAGQENYQCLVPVYARGAVLAILVFDRSSKITFTNLSYWVSFLKTNVAIDNLLVVGNKCDLPAEVSTQDAIEWCQETGADYIEVSAKTGAKIDVLFQQVAKKVAEAETHFADPQARTEEKPRIVLANADTENEGNCPC